MFKSIVASLKKEEKMKWNQKVAVNSTSTLYVLVNKAVNALFGDEELPPKTYISRFAYI